MVFSSMIFLFVFFPVILIGYYGILQKQQHRNIFLLAASLFFYSWGEPTYIVLMFLSVCINFRVGLMVNAVNLTTSFHFSPLFVTGRERKQPPDKTLIRGTLV